MITIDQKLVEYLNNFQPGGWPVGNLILCVIALVLCSLLVGAVGIEREYQGRSAGLRTHLLVGLGSTILMIISIYGFPLFLKDNGEPLFNRDVARLAAQIITGVGFLGAGAILHRNDKIKGLTTAGTIWASMAIGLACGSFNFIIAAIGTGLIVLVLTTFRKVEDRISKKNPTIILTVAGDQPALEKILSIANEFDCYIHSITSELVQNDPDKSIQISFQVNFSKKTDRLNEFMARIEKEVKTKSIRSLGH